MQNSINLSNGPLKANLITHSNARPRYKQSNDATKTCYVTHQGLVLGHWQFGISLVSGI